MQMIPSYDHTGVPLHFHSSTTSGIASLMSLRILPKVSPRQSPSSAIFSSINVEADSASGDSVFFKISSRRLHQPLYFKESSSVPASALAAHFHGVFHCVIPESQLSTVLARR